MFDAATTGIWVLLCITLQSVAVTVNVSIAVNVDDGRCPWTYQLDVDETTRVPSVLHVFLCFNRTQSVPVHIMPERPSPSTDGPLGENGEFSDHPLDPDNYD